MPLMISLAKGVIEPGVSRLAISADGTDLRLPDPPTKSALLSSMPVSDSYARATPVPTICSEADEEPLDAPRL